jgi:hypothetical protein
MLKLSRQADLERKRLEELNRTLATGIGAAQQAGGRAVVGALPAMVRAGDVGAQNILAQRQAAQLAALQLGAAGAEKEISRDMAREQQQRMTAQAAVEGGLQNISGALGNIGKAAILSDLAEKGAFNRAEKDQEKEATNLYETLDQYLSSQPAAKVSKETAIAPIIDDQGNLRAGSYMRAQEPVIKDIKSSYDSLISEREALSNLTDEQYDALLRAKELGLINFKGGGMMTGGKFSHKTNPIDIVQKGKKVGEMTGGEVILNPEQQKKLSQESAYFRSLLKKFNKKK